MQELQPSSGLPNSGPRGGKARAGERAHERRHLCFLKFFSNFFLLSANFWQTLRGPFSAVSTPNFASKHSLESS